MAFPDLFKLEKLKIQAYKDRARQQKADKIEAMFNPTTINQRYGVKYVPTQRAGADTQEAHFERVLPATLDVQLLFDGTGVDQIGLLTLFGKNETVAERIQKLLSVCYDVVGTTVDVEVRDGVTIACELRRPGATASRTRADFPA